MKNLIELECGNFPPRLMSVAVSDASWRNDNLSISFTKPAGFSLIDGTDIPEFNVVIDFELDADGARALAFAFGELAKTLGKRK